MMGTGDGYMFFGSALMWGFLLLSLVIIAALIATFLRSGSDTVGPGKDSPQDILKRRLANGEIDQEEYARLLKELR